MKRTLYDLAGADETLRFSPYCWRAKLALAHKNLSYETIPWRFTEKDKIAFSGQDKVPVLVDGNNTIAESQAIAEYLESAYPNEASLFGEPPARGLTMFVKAWTERVLHPALFLVVVPDIFDKIAARDKAYFRRSREAMLGCTIEDIGRQRPERLSALSAALAPLYTTLKGQTFIAGEAAAYADHIVVGALQWARLVSATPLWAPDDPLMLWVAAVLAAYGLS